MAVGGEVCRTASPSHRRTTAPCDGGVFYLDSPRPVWNNGPTSQGNSPLQFSARTRQCSTSKSDGATLVGTATSTVMTVSIGIASKYRLNWGRTIRIVFSNGQASNGQARLSISWMRVRPTSVLVPKPVCVAAFSYSSTTRHTGMTTGRGTIASRSRRSDRDHDNRTARQLGCRSPELAPQMS